MDGHLGTVVGVLVIVGLAVWVAVLTHRLHQAEDHAYRSQRQLGKAEAYIAGLERARSLPAIPPRPVTLPPRIPEPTRARHSSEVPLVPRRTQTDTQPIVKAS